MLKQLTFTAALLALALPTFAEDFTIKITRPMHSGDQFAYHCIWQADYTVDAPGRFFPTTSSSIDVQADIQVREVSKIGRPTWDTVTIRKCSILINGKPIAAPAPNTVFECKQSTTGHEITAGPGQLNPTTQTLLEAALPNPDEADVDKDLLLGAAVPKKIGDQWPINKQEFAKYISTLGVTADSDNITGIATLASVTTDNSQNILHIKANVDSKNLRPPDKPGVKTISATLDSTLSFDLPADPTVPTRNESVLSHSIFESSVTSANGPVTVRQSSFIAIHREYKPLKPTTTQSQK